MDYYERTDYVDMVGTRTRGLSIQLNADCTRRRARSAVINGQIIPGKRAHGEILTRILFFQLCELGKLVSACITFANFVNLTFTYVEPSSKDDYRSIRHSNILRVADAYCLLAWNMHKYYYDTK